MTTTERKPHPHAEVIKKWAEGYEIELSTDGGWIPAPNPLWYERNQYRVKPEPKKPTTWYQVVCKDHFGMFIPDGLFSSRTDAEFRGYTVVEIIPTYTEENVE